VYETAGEISKSEIYESECFRSVFLTPRFDAMGLMQVILYRSV